MAKRKPISKKLRFEVFKRDNFTCQYCGKMAPDVILEVDHIIPVKNGGKNDILNLVASCMDCNRGKGANELSDNQIIKKEQIQLKEINERREQFKLLVKWKTELNNFEEEQIDVIESIIFQNSNNSLNDLGRKNIKKCIKKFGVNETLISAELSYNQYYKDANSLAKVITYIPKICSCRKNNENDTSQLEYKKSYIRAIIRNRFGLLNANRINVALNGIVTNIDDFEIVSNFAKTSKNWSEFWININNYYNGDY